MCKTFFHNLILTPMRNIFLFLMLFFSSLCINAQKIAKVKGSSRVIYEGFVDDYKKPFGEGDLSIKYKYEVVWNYHYNDISYGKEFAILTVDGPLLNFYYRGKMKVWHTRDYESPISIVLFDGSFICDGQEFLLGDKKINIKIKENLNSDLYSHELTTAYILGKDIKCMENSKDRSLIENEIVRLCAILGDDTGKVYPDRLEKENGDVFFIKKYDDSFLINSFFVNGKKCDMGNKHDIEFDGERIYPMELDNKRGIPYLTNHYYENFIEKLPKQEGASIFKSSNDSIYILKKNNEPLKVDTTIFSYDRFYELKYTTDFKKILLNLTNLDSLEWSLYNFCNSGCLIYRGEDLTQKFNTYYNKTLAEWKRETERKEKLEYQKRCNKYGKKYVDAVAEYHHPIVGMPEKLVLEEFGVYLISDSGSTKEYRSCAFNWSIQVRNGRVSRIWVNHY